MKNGFIIIDKPIGISSFDVIRKLRRKFDKQKMGHLGTLDPLATGILVVAINQGTKLIEYLMGEDKEYLATIRLGAVSNTYDAEGEITVMEQNIDLFRSKILQAKILQEIILQNFSGKIKQIPPLFSALKINGQKACDLARKGKNIKMKPREVIINEFKILDYDYPCLKVKIDCGSGTYIRSIAHDLGQLLGVGGYLTALRRTRVGQFKIDQAVCLDEVTEENILSLETVKSQFQIYELGDQEYLKISYGQMISCSKQYSNDLVLLMLEEYIVGVGEYSLGKLRPRKLIN